MPKAATFYAFRTKCPKTGKIIAEQRTKVYEQNKGIFRFKEITGSSVRSSQVLDDGRFNLAEGQQDTVFNDVAQAQFNSSSPCGSLTLDDVEPATKRPTYSPASSPKANAKSAEDEL